jgi:hypothetical protein
MFTNCLLFRAGISAIDIQSTVAYEERLLVAYGGDPTT